MRKPSVLLLNRVYPPVHGATGRLLADLAQSLARQGYQVQVITSGSKALHEMDGRVSIQRVRGDQKPKSSFDYIVVLFRMLWAALRSPRSDLVITLSDPPMLGVIGRVLQVFKKSKHIHWVQDVYPDLFPVIGVKFPKFLMHVMAWLNRYVVARADHCVVIGRCMADLFSRKGILKAHISMIPNWTDRELVEDEAGEQAQKLYNPVSNGFAHDLGRAHHEQIKTDQKFRVLYAGNIGLVHPIETILQAAKILQNEHPEIEFLFVGDGPRYDELRTLKVREHLDNIRLLPYQSASKLKDLMHSGDVHVMSLDHAAAGMAVPCKFYAAIAAYRPVVFVGPKCSEVAQVIDAHDLGKVIAHGEAQNLANILLRFRLDSESWFAAQKAAAVAAEEFMPQVSI